VVSQPVLKTLPIFSPYFQFGSAKVLGLFSLPKNISTFFISLALLAKGSQMYFLFDKLQKIFRN